MNKLSGGNLLAVVLLGSLLVLGCAGQPGADHPATYAVTGTVTHNGQPVEGATVAFQAAAGSGGAIGVTDAGGKYALTTFKSGDGAVPGEYKVKVFKYKSQASAAVDESSEDYVAPTENEQTAGSENLLPAKYADPATSGFTATVSEDASKNVFDLTLEGE
jgi:hypothetical protein